MAGMGILGGAMSGLGEAGLQWTMKEQAAQIMAERDARIEELRMASEGRQETRELAREGRAEQATIRGEERKRSQAAAIGTQAEAARTGMTDDLSGSVRPRTPLEGAEAEAGVYRSHGLIDNAMRVQDSERGRQERGEARLDARTDRNADNVRADKQFEATTAHQKRQDDIAMANAKRLKELTDAQIDQIKGTTRVPSIKVETIEQDGVKTVVNVDQNSGAIGVVTPGARAEPGESNWFSPDKPAKPAGQPTVTWSLNGRVLPGGLGDLYPAMKARIGSAGAANQKGAKWDDSTGDVLLDGKKIGTAKTEAEARAIIARAPGSEPPQVAIEHLRKNPNLAASFEEHYKLPKGGAAKYLPAPAQKQPIVDPYSGPAVGTVAEGFRFVGGNPEDRSNWEPTAGPGAALDMARAEKDGALNRLQTYGLSQMKRDPAGFAAAQEALRQAEAAVARAEQAWQRSVGGDMGAARFVTQP